MSDIPDPTREVVDGTSNTIQFAEQDGSVRFLREEVDPSVVRDLGERVVEEAAPNPPEPPPSPDAIPASEVETPAADPAPDPRDVLPDVDAPGQDFAVPVTPAPERGDEPASDVPADVLLKDGVPVGTPTPDVANGGNGAVESPNGGAQPVAPPGFDDDFGAGDTAVTIPDEVRDAAAESFQFTGSFGGRRDEDDPGATGAEVDHGDQSGISPALAALLEADDDFGAGAEEPATAEAGITPAAAAPAEPAAAEPAQGIGEGVGPLLVPSSEPETFEVVIGRSDIELRDDDHADDSPFTDTDLDVGDEL